MFDSEIERLLGWPPRISFDDIVSHPGLPEARRLYIDRFLEVYGGDPFLVRLLIESGRFVLYHLVAMLEAAQDPARRETWLTVGLLKQQMAAYGMASGRHIDHLIARLCEVGFMVSRPSEQDRRVRILDATEKLRAHDRDWRAAHFAPLAVLYPEHDYGPVMERDPEFQSVYLRASTALIPLSPRALTAAPDMMLFLNRAGGFMVLAAVAQAIMAGDDPCAAVPYGAVGGRFGISRTHVRQLLVAAEAQGLVKLHARGGRRVEILPRLWASLDRGTAVGMYVHDVAYLLTLKTQQAAAEKRTLVREGRRV